MFTPQESWMKSAQMIKTNLHFSIKFHIYGNRAGFGKGWFLYSRHLGEVCYPQHDINKWWELNGRYQFYLFQFSIIFQMGWYMETHFPLVFWWDLSIIFCCDFDPWEPHENQPSTSPLWTSPILMIEIPTRHHLQGES